jgi:hypothetical protein
MLLQSCTNNDRLKCSIITGPSVRNQSCNMARREPQRPADPNRGNRARGNETSDGSCRHVEDRGCLADREKRLQAGGAPCRPGSFAERLPAVEEGAVISANLPTVMIGNVNLVLCFIASATSRSGCRMDPGRKLRRRQAGRRFRSSGGVSFAADKEGCIVGGRGDRLLIGSLEWRETRGRRARRSHTRRSKRSGQCQTIPKPRAI